MVVGIRPGVSKSTKKLAKKAVKQIAHEPLEILKQAGRQVSGQEQIPSQVPQDTGVEEGGISQEEKAKIQAQGKRQIESLEAEIQQIRAQEAQKEQARLQPQPVQPETKPQMVESTPKRSRKIIGGMKAKVDRQRRRREARTGISG